MGRYSNLAQEAYRTRPGQEGGAAGAPREFEQVRTSGLDEESQEAQRRAMAFYENQLQNIDADLSAKYDRASERRLGGERSTLGARGFGINSPLSAALEQRGQGELQAQRSGEEFGLATNRLGVGTQGLLGSIGMGRETYGYNPTTWNPGAGGGGGGGPAFTWIPGRPSSPDVQSAYEGNVARSRQGTQSPGAGGRPQPRENQSGALDYYERLARGGGGAGSGIY